MVGRVDWGRYEGDDVEACVAMMLNREHPDSGRIKASQGDGGVDVLDRGAGPGGGDVVYQVKRYAAPLTGSQKTKVEKSLERLLHPEKGDPRWKDLNVSQWRLVTCWDPTPEADKWLQDMGKTYKVQVVWDGLTTVDQLAAKYPEVIDSYLHDGKSAIREAYREAMTLMSLKDVGGAGLTVPEVSARVEKALRTLDGDPHYFYEYRSGHGDPAEPPPRPRHVFSQYRIDPGAGTWHAIDVLAQCAMSVEERPITISGQLTAEQGSEFAAVVQDFLDFGTPFTSPEGAYSGEIDAPGGLGGKLVDATVKIGASPGADLGDNVEMRLEVLDADDQLLAVAHVDRSERTQGAAGARVVMTEVNGVFEQTQRFNVSDSVTAKASFSLLPIEGKPVAVVRAAVDFLAAYHEPNTLRISARNAPAHLGLRHDIPPLVDAEVGTHLVRLAKVLRVLDELQQHTSTVIVVPDLDDLDADHYRGWQFAAAITRGVTVTAELKEGHAFGVVLDSGTSVPQESFSLVVPLEVAVGEQTINFGTVRADLADPELVGETSEDEVTVHWFTTPDRKVRYAKPDPSE